jgi:hypothetical protein
MNKTRLLAIVGLFAAAAANASAQALGAQFSASSFGIYTSDPSVVVTNVGGGPYDFYAPGATGSGYNLLYSAQYNSPDASYGYNEIENVSVVPGAGSAYQFNGLDYYIEITNTSSYSESFNVNLYLEQEEEIEGDGVGISYAGIREYGGVGLYCYHTVTLDSAGLSEYVVGAFTDTSSYSSPGFFSSIDSQGSFGDTLTSGESVEIELWASGYSSAASSAPGPVAALPFVAAAAVAGRRRRARRA